MKHTPGPWSVYEDDPLRIAAPEELWDRHHSMGVYKTAALVDEHGCFRRTGDARLAAAAPELLDKLKEAVGTCRCTFLQRDSGHLLECWVPSALELIAKAEVGA